MISVNAERCARRPGQVDKGTCRGRETIVSSSVLGEGDKRGRGCRGWEQGMPVKTNDRFGPGEVNCHHMHPTWMNYSNAALAGPWV